MVISTVSRTIVVTYGSGLFFGVLPALRSGRVDVRSAIMGGIRITFEGAREKALSTLVAGGDP